MKNHRSQQGSLIITAIILLVMGAVVVSTMVRMTSTNTSNAVDNLQSTDAFFLAEGGLKWAVGLVQNANCDFSSLSGSDGTFTAGGGGGSAEAGDSAGSGGGSGGSGGGGSNPNDEGDTFAFNEVSNDDGSFEATVSIVSDNFLFSATGTSANNTRALEQTYTYDDLCGGTVATPTGWQENY